MGKYFVANSYKDYIYDETKAYEKGGKLYVNAKCKCGRCVNGIYPSRIENGRPVPVPVDGGVCYSCGGTGYVRKSIRLYTEKEKAAADKRVEKLAQEKKEKLAQEARDRDARSQENKLIWFEKNGFNEEGKTYVIYGDDTYSIKNNLKELGCKYAPILNWHSSSIVELPEGYHLAEFSFDEIYEWSAQDKEAYFLPSAKELIEKRIAQLIGPSSAKYFGSIGNRFYDKTVVFSSARGFESQYGWTNILTFKSEDSVFVWFTSCDPDIEKGDVVLLTATVKKHEEFRGVETTQITRAKIVKVGE